MTFSGCKSNKKNDYGGERPRTSAYNSELLQSESLAEVSCPVSSKVGPFLGRLNSHISKDAYKLKVEELKTDVLGRAGGGIKCIFLVERNILVRYFTDFISIKSTIKQHFIHIMI